MIGKLSHSIDHMKGAVAEVKECESFALIIQVLGAEKDNLFV